jgi:hypothetical protein
MRIFDCIRFAKPLTDAIKANAEALATAQGPQIDYLQKKNFRPAKIRNSAILDKNSTM